MRKPSPLVLNSLCGIWLIGGGDLSAAEAPPMTLPKGLVAEVVAAPPLTRHPMMANFDERGRLFIAEAAGVNMKSDELDKETPNFIRMLTDTDGDGHFDKATVFADKLTFPSGAIWHEGALWVTAAPNIWRMEDTNDDGVADKREVVATGFGYTGNAADLHGPFLHPNGRIFWCHGRKDLDVHDKDGKAIIKGKGARIWSCEPDGSDVAIYAGGGMDNPVEIDFTPEGEVVGSVNLFYGRPRGDVLVHYQYGGAYPRHDQEAVLASFTRTGALLTEFHNFGHVAVSGMMRQRSASGVGGGPGDLYTSLFNTQKIVRTVVEPAGATFRHVRTEELLVIHNQDVHFTDVLEDADGTLLAIDTGGWFRNGCPTSQIAKPEIAGAIYRIRREGDYPADREADPRGLDIDWGKAAPGKLAGLLGDDRYAVCERAIGEMASRGEAALSELKTVLESGNETARRNAVWALTRIGNAGARKLVRRAFSDAEVSVRQTACNSVWRTRDPEAVKELAVLLGDKASRVQLAAARALGRVGDPGAVKALLAYAQGSMDRVIDHTVIYALIEIGDAKATAAGLASGSTTRQARALWALGGMEGALLKLDDVLPHLATDSEELNAAAAAICKARPEWAPGIAEHFERWVDEGKVSEVRKGSMGELISHFLGEGAMGALAGKLLANGDRDLADAAFGWIAGSPAKVAMHADWEKPFGAAIGGKDEARLEMAMAALGVVETKAFDDVLRGIGDDELRSPLVRVKAIAAVADPSKPLSANAFGLLKQLFTSGDAATQRVEAANLLVGARLTSPQRIEVAGLVAEAGPVELSVLLQVFRTRDAPTGMALLESLEKCQAIGSIRPTELQRIITRFPPEVLEAAKPFMAKLAARAEEQAARMAGMEEKLEKGNAKKGEEAFLAGKGACIICHKVGEQGREVGPDLSRIGRIRTKHDLLESLLFPSASLARDFEPFEVVTKDGQTLFGIIQKESADTVHLVDATGIAKPVARSAIKEIRPGAFSLMPQGLEQAMTPEELVDLVAYLDSLE